MKRFLAFLIVVLLLSGITLVTSADNVNTTKVQTITTDVPDDPSWTLEIPADLTINFGDEYTPMEGKCAITDLKNVRYDMYIHASITYEMNLHHENDYNRVLPYAIEVRTIYMDKENSSSDDWIMIDTSGTDKVWGIANNCVKPPDNDWRSYSELRVHITEEDWNRAATGKYTGTVIYGSDVEDHA